MSTLVCPRCGDLNSSPRIFCFGCGAALLTREATEAALARIRADGESNRLAVRRENGRRTTAGNRGRKLSRCRYCGCRCYGDRVCAEHRPLVAAEGRE